MLYAVFRGHELFVVLAIVLVLAVGAFRYRAVRVARAPRPVLHALLAAAVTGVVALTLWTTGSPTEQSRVCVVNADLLEPLGTTQGLLNAGMFVPIGLLGVLATRNIAATVLGGLLLTAAIETAQGALTFLGRGCDTSDLQMNALGVLAGAALGWGVAVLDARGPGGSRTDGAWHRATRRSIGWSLSSAVFLGAVWVVFIHPEKVEYTVAVTTADESQQDAARAAVTAAFGDHYEIKRFEFARGPHGTGTVIATLDEGFVELSWPDRRTVQASLDMADSGRPSGYPVSGTTTPTADAAAARALATRYAEEHAPWGLTGGAKPVTVPVGERAELGWMTSWRRQNAAGVLQPMRLDIQIDRSGTVTQLIMRDIADPRLPRPRVSRTDAVDAFQRAASQDGAGRDGAKPERIAAQLVAQSVEGTWRICWLVHGEVAGTTSPAATSGGITSGGIGTATIDALSGEVVQYDVQPPGADPTGDLAP
ncbi:VanZ family protein [Streptomyces sp. NPDC090025]|uniref:VanZ family protein n=1 Tax=Streptomyces sp. NPDC090025 TaxID=3365922 RepID=UPI0038358037